MGVELIHLQVSWVQCACGLCFSSVMGCSVGVFFCYLWLCDSVGLSGSLALVALWSCASLALWSFVALWIITKVHCCAFVTNHATMDLSTYYGPERL